MSKLTGVSLFAGVGGFDLAMERNGVNVVAAVEIDKKCQEVLAHLIANYLMM
jgi:DNA (cytosine-5)-methyltransferase 1